MAIRSGAKFVASHMLIRIFLPRPVYEVIAMLQQIVLQQILYFLRFLIVCQEHIRKPLFSLFCSREEKINHVGKAFFIALKTTAIKGLSGVSTAFINAFPVENFCKALHSDDKRQIEPSTLNEWAFPCLKTFLNALVKYLKPVTRQNLHKTALPWA